MPSKSIGLPRHVVRIAPHRPEWREEFRRERNQLQRVLGAMAVDIQHIGSTAVPNLRAKPIIDIAVSVRTLQDARRCIEPLQTLGYAYRGQNNIPHHRLFVKGPESNRTHYVHVVQFDGQRWKDYLLFRNLLRSKSDLRTAYAELKASLRRRFPGDRAAYTKGKSRFIRASLRQARLASEAGK